MTLAFIFVFMAMSQITHVTAEAPKPEILESVADLQKSEYSNEDIITLIGFYSEKYNVDSRVMQQVVYHESRYDEHAIGDNGKSHGLSQIHLPSHPNVSEDDAYNPHFALKFLANKLSEGKGRLWTGYRLCELNEVIYHEGKRLYCHRLPN